METITYWNVSVYAYLIARHFRALRALVHPALLSGKGASSLHRSLTRVPSLAYVTA
ncbi:MAG: hypothetical protein IT367_14035 [Candidatus Hydrogenedentes bacterium]|nr:hypothetical protein [Candidatus Hydrogenedentota bacterium]